jgi:hypothetical protein
MPDPRGPTAALGTPRQVPENVEALVAHTREVAAVDRDRNHHADVRAAGLAVVSNGLLAVGATVAPRLAQFQGASWIEEALPLTFAAALLLLLSAGVSAALALRLTAAPEFRPGHVASYRETAVQRAEPLRLQQRLLDKWVAAVLSEQLTYDAKLAHLRRAYGLFVAGLVALVTVAATLAEGGIQDASTQPLQGGP